MRTYTGKHTVKGGYYFNRRDWKLEVVEGDAGTLPGTEDVRYYRVPALALVVLAPAMGLAFVVALPFIGLAVIAEHVGRYAVTLVRARKVPAPETPNPLR